MFCSVTFSPLVLDIFILTHSRRVKGDFFSPFCFNWCAFMTWFLIRLALITREVCSVPLIILCLKKMILLTWYILIYARGYFKGKSSIDSWPQFLWKIYYSPKPFTVACPKGVCANYTREEGILRLWFCSLVHCLLSDCSHTQLAVGVCLCESVFLITASGTLHRSIYKCAALNMVCQSLRKILFSKIEMYQL